MTRRITLATAAAAGLISFVSLGRPAAADPVATGSAEAGRDYNFSEVPPCADDSDVVGYRRCTPYGTWGLDLREPYAFVTAGINFRHLPALGAPTGGRSPRGTTIGAAPASPGMSEAVTFSERLGFALPRTLYLAFDFELGNLTASGEPDTAPDIVLVGAVALGLRGGLGPLGVSVELAAGGMAHSYAEDGDMRGAGLVEGRGRADLWLSPWFSVGGTLGTSLLDRELWLAGFHIGFHSHAFAGDR
jgi:hypothetical protein